MRLFFFTFCALVVFVAGLHAETTEVEYYAILMEGKKIGHVTQTRVIGDGIVTTTEDMMMTLARGPVTMTVGTIETSIETTAGEPLGFEVVQNISGMSTKIVGKVTSQGKAEATIDAMGMKQNKTIDYPAGAIMAEGMRILQMEKGLKAGTTYEAMVFSPSMLTSVNARVAVGEKKEVDLFGRITKLTEVKVSMNLPTGAINSTSYVDSELRALKTLIPTMGMNLELIACDKEFALSENDVVDFLDKMLVKSPVVLSNVKSKKSAEYTLLPSKDAKLSIPSGDGQTVKKLSDGRFIVEVKPVVAKEGVKFPYKGRDAKILEALESTQYLQCDNEEVARLARDAVGDTKDAAQAARRIESFVAGYITEKNLSVGYASAAEVAASRQGDCTEHAVLTAAMCRAVGIPSRVVFGIVYVDEFLGRKHVFGGHAWTQAWIGDEWVCFDATRAPNGYGVGHIVLATGGGDPADFFGMVNTLGYFTIEKIVLK